jgi:hypothetical protein
MQSRRCVQSPFYSSIFWLWFRPVNVLCREVLIRLNPSFQLWRIEFEGIEFLWSEAYTRKKHGKNTFENDKKKKSFFIFGYFWSVSLITRKKKQSGPYYILHGLIPYYTEKMLFLVLTKKLFFLVKWHENAFWWKVFCQKKSFLRLFSV